MLNHHQSRVLVRGVLGLVPYFNPYPNQVPSGGPQEQQSQTQDLTLTYSSIRGPRHGREQLFLYSRTLFNT